MDITFLDSIVYRNIEYLYQRGNGGSLSTRRYILHLYYYIITIKFILHMWITGWTIDKSKTLQTNPIELVPWGNYDFFLGVAAYHFPINFSLIICTSVFPISAIIEHLIIYRQVDNISWSVLYDVTNRNRHYIETINHDLFFTFSIRSVLNQPSKTIKSYVKTFLLLFGYVSDPYEMYYHRLKLYSHISITKRKFFLSFVMYVELIAKMVHIFLGKNFFKTFLCNLFVYLIMIFFLC